MRTSLAAILLLGTMSVAAPGAWAKGRDVIGYFWVPDKDSSPYWTVADHSDCFSTLAPTWLSYDATGKFNNNSDRRLLRWARGRGLKVTPLVANSPFKAETARPIFADDASVKRNVALLLKTVNDLGADGINVDIEGVAPADRPLYNTFIAALCDAFHAAGLKVTADLPAKTSDAPDASWAGFADYAFLGKHLDQLQLMCYDEHWSGGKPGPVASLPWVEDVLKYAVSVIPREKVVLGMPFYGYDWPPAGNGAEVTGERAQELLNTLHQKAEWDATNGTSFFTYTDGTGATHTAYFETARSLGLRLDLARKYRVAGVSIWRLGDETPDFWAPLKRYRQGK